MLKLFSRNIPICKGKKRFLQIWVTVIWPWNGKQKILPAATNWKREFFNCPCCFLQNFRKFDECSQTPTNSLVFHSVEILKFCYHIGDFCNLISGNVSKFLSKCLRTFFEIPNLPKLRNWFQVKVEWHEYFQISTLWFSKDKNK